MISYLKKFSVLLFCFAILGCNLSKQSTSIKDQDGNVYTSIIINSQEWLVENLKTTKYSDGTPIFNNVGVSQLDTLPAYVWYDLDEDNKEVYGGLYNWYAVNTGKLCPTGWQIPSKSDWESLLEYLGGEAYAGGKLKEAGTAHWKSPNKKADNSSGFTALPGGILDEYGEFRFIGEYGGWWSASETDSARAPLMDTHHAFGKAFSSGSDKKAFFSVRCMRTNNINDE